MKIINNTELNNLILFAKNNLGIYKLVYKEKKKIYFLSIISVIIAVMILILYIILIISHVNLFWERLCVITCLFNCLCSFVLLKYIEAKTKVKRLKIQHERYNLLKKFYNEKHYDIKDIKIINQQLNKRIEKIQKQKVTILVVMGAMILPIWDVIIQAYFRDFSPTRIAKLILLLIMFSVIALVIIRFLNKTLCLYEENFYIKNNTAIIENLMYLNGYIIEEKEERSNNGRRR